MTTVGRYHFVIPALRARQGSLKITDPAVDAGRPHLSAGIYAALAERVSKYTMIVDLPNGYSADDTLAGLIEACEQIPAHLRRSITWDRGSEMARWADLATTFGLVVWFCDPHAPRQRGLNEHTNRLIRWWLPRGIDLASSNALDRIHQAQHVLNHQPRRSLDWAHPTSATLPSLADHWNSRSCMSVVGPICRSSVLT